LETFWFPVLIDTARRSGEPAGIVKKTAMENGIAVFRIVPADS
jgi:hypothetical protein